MRKIIITDEEKKIVTTILKQWANTTYDNMWCGYNQLYDTIIEEYHIEIKVGKLKKIMRELRNSNIVYFATTTSPDGVSSGSGYFLSEEELK